MTNKKKAIVRRLGRTWWDLDENMDVAIECHKPLRGKHYLLTIHTPRRGPGCASDAIEIAEIIIDALKRIAEQE